MEVTTRDVTATCPPAEVVRLQFETPVPSCVSEFEPFQVPVNIRWGDLTVDQKTAIAARDICLEEVVEWEAARQSHLKRAETDAGT